MICFPAVCYFDYCYHYYYFFFYYSLDFWYTLPHFTYRAIFPRCITHYPSFAFKLNFIPLNSFFQQKNTHPVQHANHWFFAKKHCTKCMLVVDDMLRLLMLLLYLIGLYFVSREAKNAITMPVNRRTCAFVVVVIGSM